MPAGFAYMLEVTSNPGDRKAKHILFLNSNSTSNSVANIDSLKQD